jgi:hypothetical protein
MTLDILVWILVVVAAVIIAWNAFAMLSGDDTPGP